MPSSHPRPLKIHRTISGRAQGCVSAPLTHFNPKFSVLSTSPLESHFRQLVSVFQGPFCDEIQGLPFLLAFHVFVQVRVGGTPPSLSPPCSQAGPPLPTAGQQRAFRNYPDQQVSPFFPPADVTCDG